MLNFVLNLMAVGLFIENHRIPFDRKKWRRVSSNDKIVGCESKILRHNTKLRVFALALAQLHFFVRKIVGCESEILRHNTQLRVFALALAPLHFFAIRTYTVGNIRIPKTQDFSHTRLYCVFTRFFPHRGSNNLLIAKLQIL